jgi:ATP-dependent Clp protease ATP-binding subunit ClpC
MMMVSDYLEQLIMPNTMARLTRRARKVLNISLKEAEKLDDSMIHSGHLLLGLIQVDGSVSEAVLKDISLSADKVRETIEALVFFKSWRRSESGNLRIIALGADLKRSLAYSVDEANQRRDYDIGTEHLLLGLCRNENSPGVEILKQLNISTETIRQKTLDILNAS